MRLLRNLGSWCADRLKDLFYANGNQHLDLNRSFAGLAGAMMLGGMLWNVHKGQPIDLGPGGLGGGLAAVIGAAGLAIGGKAWAEAQLLKARDQSK